MRAPTLAVLLLPLLTMAAAGQQYDSDALRAWRATRETTLKGDTNWLTVAGLHFLSPGENRIGRAATNDIVLDFPSVPDEAGAVVLEERRVTLRAPAGTMVRVNGQEVAQTELRLSEGKRPADLVSFGPVSFFVHYSGPRLALRVRNLDNPIRTGFKGLRWFDPAPAFRVPATFERYGADKTVEIPNILGDIEPFTAIGTVAFSLGGQSHRMEAWRSGENLWLVFRDLTSARETYPSARFLYTPMPTSGNGEFMLDFNYAQNPPCAYNPYTTCPLPPPQNRLKVRVEAGELTY